MAAMLRRRHATGAVVLGSVSWPVVAGSPVPVLLTHPNQEVAPHYGRVVVGVDGSMAERAIGPAVDLAGRLGARLLDRRGRRPFDAAEPAAGGRLRPLPG